MNRMITYVSKHTNAMIIVLNQINMKKLKKFF